MKLNDDGFTLIEVLIAVFLMAMLSTLGLVLLNSALRTKEQLSVVISASEDMQLMRAILKEDLLQLTLRRNKDPQGQRLQETFIGGDLAGDEALLAFVTNGRERVDPDTRLSSLQYVEYVYENAQLIRRSRDVIDPAPDTELIERVLLNEVADVWISFYNGVEWLDYWEGISTNEEGGAPLAVRLSLATPRFGETEMLFATPEVFR